MVCRIPEVSCVFRTGRRCCGRAPASLHLMGGRAPASLHLMGEDRAPLLWHLVPRGDALAALGEHRIFGDDAQRLLPLEGLGPQRIPPLVVFALVLGDPLLRHVVRSVRRPRREVDEERLVRCQRLLLIDVVDGPIGEVGHQVVVGIIGCLYEAHAVDERRRPLVGLTADEAVELLETAERRPVIEGSRGP